MKFDILSRFKAWFANFEFKNISLFNRTYKQELYIVCESVEKMYKLTENTPLHAEVKNLKDVIKAKTKRDGVSKHFSKFLVKKKLMKPEQVTD